MRKRELKNVEWSILIIAIILCVIGLVALFSATNETMYMVYSKFNNNGRSNDNRL